MTILDDNPPDEIVIQTSEDANRHEFDENPPHEIVVQSPKDANGHESLMPIHPSLSDASIGTGSSTYSIGKFVTLRQVVPGGGNYIEVLWLRSFDFHLIFLLIIKIYDFATLQYSLEDLFCG